MIPGSSRNTRPGSHSVLTDSPNHDVEDQQFQSNRRASLDLSNIFLHDEYEPNVERTQRSSQLSGLNHQSGLSHGQRPQPGVPARGAPQRRGLQRASSAQAIMVQRHLGDDGGSISDLYDSDDDTYSDYTTTSDFTEVSHASMHQSVSSFGAVSLNRNRVSNMLSDYSTFVASRNAPSEEEQRQREGRRYFEQHQQFNDVDQSVNLMMPSSHNPTTRQGSLLALLGIVGSTGMHLGPSTGTDSRPGAEMEEIDMQDPSNRQVNKRSAETSVQNLNNYKVQSVNTRKSILLPRIVSMSLCMAGPLLLLLMVGLSQSAPGWLSALPRVGSTRKIVSSGPGSTGSDTIGSSLDDVTMESLVHMDTSNGIQMVTILPPSGGSETIRIEALKHKILENKVSTAQDLHDTNSIPYFALRWLSDTDDKVLSADDDETIERYALAVLCYSVNMDIARSHSNKQLQGPLFKDWLTQKSICNWEGVTCQYGSVVGLNLANRGAKGTLPDELRALSNLKSLNLSKNNLKGRIPHLIDRHSGNGLHQLSVLRLEDNKFSGTIPAIGDLGNLVQVKLNNNNLHGKIPSKLMDLSNLELLHLGNNRLSGSIPTEIEHLSSLKELKVMNNRLSKRLPDLRILSNLYTILLGNNQFSGTLPRTWGHLTELKNMVVNHNNVTGIIPPVYGDLTKLKHMWLGDNDLVGTIPSELSGLTHLESLYLDMNKLSGTVPTELGSLTSIDIIHLQRNPLLGGTIPAQMCDLKTDPVNQHHMKFISSDCSFDGPIQCDCCDECY